MLRQMLEDNVSRDEAEKHRARILAFIKPGKENDGCCRVLQILFDQCVENPEATIHQRPLAEGAALPLDEDQQNSTLVRLAIDKLRKELLPQFYQQNPREVLQFDIPSNPRGIGYNLIIKPRAPASDAGTREDIPIIFNYRKHTGQWFRNVVCGPANILFVTVGSQHTLDTILPWFESGDVKAQHFRVLIWRPQSEEIAAAFSDHTGESATLFFAKQGRAWNSWKKIEGEYPFIEAYGYTSVPTMQALCEADISMQVEILPFYRPSVEDEYSGGAGVTDHRPALWLTAAEHARSFRFFKNSFEKLWMAAMAWTPEDEVHPRWRERRKALLSEGLPRPPE